MPAHFHSGCGGGENDDITHISTHILVATGKNIVDRLIDGI